MRIVIDLQGAQTGSSRYRGIGRYSTSFAKALIRNAGEHEVHIALNGSIADTIPPIREEFGDLLPQDRIHVWGAIAPVNMGEPETKSRRRAALLIREAFLSNLKPDFVHVTSHFEGYGDNSVSSVGLLGNGVRTSVTLYDLIPYIHRKPYLADPTAELWYEERIDHIRRADLLLAISESSRQEAIDYLSFPDEAVVNAGTAADDQFVPVTYPASDVTRVLKRHHITRPFVMYTGGIDFRKNIDGLIRGYALLPAEVRSKHQLAIVCSVRPNEKTALLNLARDSGLKPDEVIMTGFVPEEDLILMYNSCKLFVFPSWHEGFGLPALEAMKCGAPVIGANRSSLPEVIGLDDALFDPFSDTSIRDAIARGLTDESYRKKLVEHGKTQAELFSWDHSAQVAIAAMEATVKRDRHSLTPHRPRLAFVSPIKPARSGIAEYASELLPELARHYEIDVVVKNDEAAKAVDDPFVKSVLRVITFDQFKERFADYERVLYQIGNSDHHDHMLRNLAAYPGMVVLHDFFLSGVMNYVGDHVEPGYWERELYLAHGYPALVVSGAEESQVRPIRDYPVSRIVADEALGIIVHSAYSRKLANVWYGEHTSDDWAEIPHLRVPVHNVDRKAARKRLGIGEDELLVCSFGFLYPTKHSEGLLDAWLASPMAKDPKARLVFVGENSTGEYSLRITKKVASSSNVSVSGWADTDKYRDYLAAADVAVQLRTISRGETSGAVLDCMNYGAATIVNANGSMADLPEAAVVKLPDEFTQDQLIKALSRLAENSKARTKVAEAGRKTIVEDHSPRRCADAYAAAIERAYEAPESSAALLAQKIMTAVGTSFAAEDRAQLANAIDIATRHDARVCYLDVTGLLGSDGRFGKKNATVIADSLTEDLGVRVEPIRFDAPSQTWVYARTASLKALNLEVGLRDDPVEFRDKASLVLLESSGDASHSKAVDHLAAQFGPTVLRASKGASRDKAAAVDHPLTKPLGQHGYTLATA